MELNRQAINAERRAGVCPVEVAGLQFHTFADRWISCIGVYRSSTHGPHLPISASMSWLCQPIYIEPIAQVSQIAPPSCTILVLSGPLLE